MYVATFEGKAEEQLLDAAFRRGVQLGRRVTMKELLEDAFALVLALSKLEKGEHMCTRKANGEMYDLTVPSEQE